MPVHVFDQARYVAVYLHQSKYVSAEGFESRRHLKTSKNVFQFSSKKHNRVDVHRLYTHQPTHYRRTFVYSLTSKTTTKKKKGGGDTPNCNVCKKYANGTFADRALWYKTKTSLIPVLANCKQCKQQWTTIAATQNAKYKTLSELCKKQPTNNQCNLIGPSRQGFVDSLKTAEQYQKYVDLVNLRYADPKVPLV